MSYEPTLQEALAAMPDDLLNAVAQMIAGDGCCGFADPDDGNRCCMSDSARAVFALIEAETGLSLAALEDMRQQRTAGAKSDA